MATQASVIRTQLADQSVTKGHQQIPPELSLQIPPALESQTAEIQQRVIKEMVAEQEKR